MIIKTNISKKEFNKGEFTPIMNLPFRKELIDSLSVPKQISMNASCGKKMKEVFGAKNFGTRYVHLISSWVLEYKNHKFAVHTAKGRGTSYEVLDKNIDQETVSEFLNYILDNILIDKVKEYEQFEK